MSFGFLGLCFVLFVCLLKSILSFDLGCAGSGSKHLLSAATVFARVFMRGLPLVLCEDALQEHSVTTLWLYVAHIAELQALA